MQTGFATQKLEHLGNMDKHYSSMSPSEIAKMQNTSNL